MMLAVTFIVSMMSGVYAVCSVELSFKCKLPCSKINETLGCYVAEHLS